MHREYKTEGRCEVSRFIEVVNLCSVLWAFQHVFSKNVGTCSGEGEHLLVLPPRAWRQCWSLSLIFNEIIRFDWAIPRLTRD